MADRNSNNNQAPTDSPVSSPRSSTDSRNASSRNSFRPGSLSSTQARQSFGDSLRAAPSSPRARRQPSLTQSAIQSLIDNPPTRNAADPAFSGRDWTQITVGELVSPDDFRFVEADTGIEEATNLLIESGAHVLIREKPEDKTAIGNFDYTDLNAYLLLVVGLTLPDEEHVTPLRELARKAREGTKIPLKDVKDLGLNDRLTTLGPTANLRTAVEVFGSGIHHIVVAKEDTSEVVGVFSQFRLVRFLWENGQGFPAIDQLYPQYLRDLRVGSQSVICINGDKPLSQALELMNSEGISSLAVVDNQLNVIGNISVVDVKLLTKSSSLPLLDNTCTHFISVILSTRGINEGRDSFPVFYVNPQSTLAHTVAKLVATKSHRMWMTDPQSPSSSGPPTPSHSAVQLPISPPANHAASVVQPASVASNAPIASPRLSPATLPTSPQPLQAQPYNPAPPPLSQPSPTTLPMAMSSAIPASSLPGARLSGRLVGVVSLTDILNLYGRASGLSPIDPNIFRSQRRRSSSSSLGIRKSGDIARELYSR